MLSVAFPLLKDKSTFWATVTFSEVCCNVCLLNEGVDSLQVNPALLGAPGEEGTAAD